MSMCSYTDQDKRYIQSENISLEKKLSFTELGKFFLPNAKCLSTQVMIQLGIVSELDIPS